MVYIGIMPSFITVRFVFFSLNLIKQKKNSFDQKNMMCRFSAFFPWVKTLIIFDLPLTHYFLRAINLNTKVKVTQNSRPSSKKVYPTSVPARNRFFELGLTIFQFFAITSIILKIPTEHRKSKESLNSKLQIESICSIGILSIPEVIAKMSFFENRNMINPC